jgi:glyceraldehyde-3-phosphate dehydrogenase (NADP+)
MWEICKNRADAEKEVDRTVDYINATIVELKRLENSFSKFVQVGGVVGHERRAPLGVTLVMGPFNYPLNETYTLLIPALIMGNTVIMKLPRTGYLCHMPTLELFASCFPPGVVNTISGAGRETMPPLMKTGKIDVFAFIGTNSAANQLIKQHPAPHRLRICLGLDAKNPAIILPSADIKATVSEVVLGALSYNGQRCTAIKIVFVHESIVDLFLPELIKQVDALKIGLPWESGVKITPLPEPDKPEYIRTVIEDATNKGARIVNANGGQYDRSMVSPNVLYPVTSNMRVYAEEQFGPIIPVVTFNDISEIVKYLTECEFGQQASIFSTNASEIATLTDILVHQVCRVNVNAQCQRGPDTFPFTGRKNSAAGTLSISDALRTFSIRSMVATKDDQKNRELLTNVVQSNQSNFLRLDHIF